MLQLLQIFLKMTLFNRACIKNYTFQMETFITHAQAGFFGDKLILILIGKTWFCYVRNQIVDFCYKTFIFDIKVICFFGHCIIITNWMTWMFLGINLKSRKAKLILSESCEKFHEVSAPCNGTVKALPKHCRFCSTV